MLVTGVGCAVSLLWSLGSLWRLLQQQRAENGQVATKDRAGWQQRLRRRQRRMLAAAIVGMISVVFFLAVNFIDHINHPRSFAALWFVVLLMLLWLVFLAVADAIQTFRDRASSMDSLREQLLREFPPRHKRSESNLKDGQKNGNDGAQENRS